MKTIVPTAAKTGPRVGHDDPPVRTPVAEPVDPRRVLQLPRETQEVLPEEERRERAENSVGTISPRSVETQPSDETSTKLGTKVTAAGIISVPRIA